MKKSFVILIVLVAVAAAGIFFPLFDARGEPVCKPAVAPPLPEILPWVRWQNLAELSYEKAQSEGDQKLWSSLRPMFRDRSMYILVNFPRWGEGLGEGNGTVWTWTVVRGDEAYILVIDATGFVRVYRVGIPERISLWQRVFNRCR